MNPVAPSSITTGSLWDEVAEELRRVTVEIIGPRGNRGAGVIWSSDGLIVTSAHVVDRSAMIRLHDGKTHHAELLRRDQKADLAALRFSARGVESAKLRDSRTLRAGEIVLAVGHPMGITGAVSTGIVHAGSPGSVIEADIRLAPGNSGGPLADAAGYVVGINCMVVNGMGVAITTETIQRFLGRADAAGEATG